MSTKAATTRERNRRRTIGALQAMIAAITTAPVMRRAATLRLGRLRAATTAPAKPALTLTTRAKPTAPTGKAIFEAAQSFRALTRQRTALCGKHRRTAGEWEILKLMSALMPPALPEGNDPRIWSDFSERVALVLDEIKTVKIL